MRAHFLLIPAVMTALATGAAAAPDYIGSMCITSVSAECAAVGWAVGGCSQVRLRPGNVGSNGPSTRLSFFFDTFALNYTLASGSIVGTAYKDVVGTRIGQSASQFPAQMRFRSQKPSAVATDTAVITISGNIKEWDDPESNCAIGFDAVLQKRP